MEADKLKSILESHSLWLQDKDGTRANLLDADLRHADLRDADLLDANLHGANLHGADLRGADLRDADLRDVDLRDADLRDADLRDADLRDADLRHAGLCDANLRDANLHGANLCYANLRGADLLDANLLDVNLLDADLHGALGLPIAADAPARLLAVARAALAAPDALEMSNWHTCQTTHCICGWASHLGGPLAELIIRVHGNDIGGLMLLGIEAHAHFYKTNDEARAFLQSVIDNAQDRPAVERQS